MIIGGIDNGLQGGLVFLIEGEPMVRVVMPTIELVSSGKVRNDYDEHEVAALLRKMRPDHVYLEKAQAMAKAGKDGKNQSQGTVSAFSTGKGFGIMRGLLAGIGIPFTEVHPRTWQAAMLAGVAADDTKAAAAMVCRRLWPDVDWRATERSKKPHEGIVDAALIGEYGRRALTGQLAAPARKTSRK